MWTILCSQNSRNELENSRNVRICLWIRRLLLRSRISRWRQNDEATWIIRNVWWEICDFLLVSWVFSEIGDQHEWVSESPERVYYCLSYSSSWAKWYKDHVIRKLYYFRLSLFLDNWISKQQWHWWCWWLFTKFKFQVCVTHFLFTRVFLVNKNSRLLLHLFNFHVSPFREGDFEGVVPWISRTQWWWRRW